LTRTSFGFRVRQYADVIGPYPNQEQARELIQYLSALDEHVAPNAVTALVNFSHSLHVDDGLAFIGHTATWKVPHLTNQLASHLLYSLGGPPPYSKPYMLRLVDALAAKLLPHLQFDSEPGLEFPSRMASYAGVTFVNGLQRLDVDWERGVHPLCPLRPTPLPGMGPKPATSTAAGPTRRPASEPASPARPAKR
jgi:hypothetical protein